MSYNKRVWNNGDLITKERMNNIEDGIYDAHDKINAINNKVEENTTDTNTARQDISDIKLQIGTEELTTTSKKIKGAINLEIILLVFSFAPYFFIFSFSFAN